MSATKYTDTLREIRSLVNKVLKDVESGNKEGKGVSRDKPRHKPIPQDLLFELNVLAFMNKHAKGLRGDQKFALLLARMVKGNLSTEVPFQEIRSQWNKMKTVLGPFNPAHGNRAKAMGWVDSQQRGKWKLTPTWKKSLQGR